MTRNFLLAFKSFQNGFQNGEGWHLFYCDSTLGCRIIQDYDLNKLDDL